MAQIKDDNAVLPQATDDAKKAQSSVSGEQEVIKGAKVETTPTNDSDTDTRVDESLPASDKAHEKEEPEKEEMDDPLRID